MGRDLSKAQFERALTRHGFKKAYFGYWDYGAHSIHPTIFLGSKRNHYREKLVGMISKKERIDNEASNETK